MNWNVWNIIKNVSSVYTTSVTPNPQSKYDYTEYGKTKLMKCKLFYKNMIKDQDIIAENMEFTD